MYDFMSKKIVIYFKEILITYAYTWCIVNVYESQYQIYRKSRLFDVDNKSSDFYLYNKSSSIHAWKSKVKVLSR